MTARHTLAAWLALAAIAGGLPTSASGGETGKIVRGERAPALADPRLLAAYEKLRTADVDGAIADYAASLRKNPKNLDALLGMAVIAQRRHDPAGAERWYRQALAADPGDPDAQAGMIGLRGAADPLAAESRLHQLLATHAESAALNFALGNLYAGQQRWGEAQRAYFRAHAADSTNPDYLYNLACSLDQLHRPTLAASHYRAALAAASLRPGSFDPARVEARLGELAR
ncbi:MAG TPA: tetratricopeptide repeat protein [Azospira sp.]|nr:tetratricopeptide repeat protein [Azospira sp.]